MDQAETKPKKEPASTKTAAGRLTFNVRRYGKDGICFDRGGIRTPLTIEEAKVLVTELTELMATIGE